MKYIVLLSFFISLPIFADEYQCNKLPSFKMDTCTMATGTAVTLNKNLPMRIGPDLLVMSAYAFKNSITIQAHMNEERSFYEKLAAENDTNLVSFEDMMQKYANTVCKNTHPVMVEFFRAGGQFKYIYRFSGGEIFKTIIPKCIW